MLWVLCLRFAQRGQIPSTAGQQQLPRILESFERRSPDDIDINFLKRGRPPGVALDGEKERAARRKRERRRAERSGTKENPSTYEVAYTIYSYHGGKIGSKAELFGSAEEVRQWWHRARRDIDVRVQWAKKDGKFISFADLLFRR